MNVPPSLFLFLQHAPSSIDHSKSFNAAFREFRDTLAPVEKREIAAFLERAMNEEETVGDGAAIAMTSPELDDTIIIVTDKQTNREYFGELLSLFRTAQP